METLNIAQISTAVYSLPPTEYAGIEQVVYDLSKQLSSMGHNVTMIAPQGSAMESEIGATCDIIETVPPSLSNDEFGAFNVYRDKLDGFDIIHDHTHMKCVYTHESAKALNICSTLHNQVNFSRPAPVPKMNLIGVSSHQSLHTSGVLGVPVRYVYNGVDLNRYKYTTEKTDRLLFLSRIAKFKGAHEAIAIAKRLHLPLDVAGEDVFVNDPPYVHSIMSSCTGDMVYHGTVPDSIKVSLLSSARALILPLLWDEPFGLVAVEALASGTPVIALRRGAMPEILIDGETGFLCETIPEMEAAIDKIDSISPAKCVKRAEDFTVEKMASNYVSMYKDILNGEGW